jgi:iron complex outermembrane receptor protein
MLGSIPFKSVLASGTALIALASVMPQAALAQTTQTGPTGQTAPMGQTYGPGTSLADKDADKEILVTGSRIKQDPNNSALPLQIVTTQELQRNSISSPEQLIAFLPDNGSGADNLASNSDVVTNERRGNNGASFANLRGQGSAATLVLLNGLRVAAQGTTGSAVDVNQIPFMALDRVEVLKDGASAIYGTDAVGGVINFITKRQYTGFGASAYSDVTDKGDAPIYRLSAIAGFGDLDRQGFNVMGTVGYSWVAPLDAHDRSFINTYQHDRGLSTDTRGSPFATIVNLAGTSFPTTGAFPLIPGTTIRATGGINVLRLPGQAGCGAITDEGNYDTDVWASPGFGLACSFDTGKNVFLQQRINTLTYFGRAVKRFGPHELSLEVTGSIADSDKMFSQVQITPNTTTQNYAYRLVPGVNDATFNNIINIINTTFPGQVALNSASSFSYRWRCTACGEREIATTNSTFRATLGLTGPIASSWDYNLTALYADSVSNSTLGSGYYYRGTTDAGVVDGPGLIPLLNSGVINPFLFPGQTQSAAALAALQTASAAGVQLYGGKYSVKQADASVSGSLFRLPGGMVKIAAGIDYRRESYSFGDHQGNQRIIIAAPFDNLNNLGGVNRDIKAAYAELLVPLFRGLEVSAAGRIDDYTGFGTTTNPKLSIKYRPIKQIMFRGSYNTAFRVPAFNQIFNPHASAIFTGSQFADPKNCPGGVINVATGCTSLNGLFNVISGGTANLGPETAREFSAGVVLEPSRHLSVSVD